MTLQSVRANPTVHPIRTKLPRPRTAVMRGTAFTAVIAMAAGSILLTAGPAAAATTVAQSNGRFLSGSVGSTNLDNIVSIAPASATNDGTTPTTSSNHPLDATVLSAVQADLGSGLNLLGSNGVITLGAVNQYASASSDGSSKSASGAVNNSGAIAVGGANGLQSSDATIDLTKLLGSPVGPGLAVLSAGTVQVGAVSATANETAARVQTGTYKIADLKLNLTSPLVTNLTSSLRAANLTTLLTGLGVNGLAVLGNLPDLSATVANIPTAISADGAVSVNIGTGVISVDVAKVLKAAGLDLNNLPQDTEIVPIVVDALTTRLPELISGAVDALVAQVGTAVGGITATLGVVTLPIGAILSSLTTTLTDPLTAALPNLGTTLVDPITATLSGLLSLTGNVKSTSAGRFTQSALRLTLVPGATPVAQLRLASASVGPNAPLPVPTALSLAPNRGPVTGGTTVVVTGTGFVVGGTSITIGGNTVPATSVAVNPAGTTATFSTPAHPVGAVGVTVTTPGGTSTPALTYTYDPLSALSLNPTHGPATGGTSVTVTGSGFVPGSTSVTIGGATIPAASVSVNPTGTTATFTTLAHAVGPVPVTVTTPAGTTSPALTYTFDPGRPTGVSLSPTHGPAIGGTQVTVTGTGFVQGSTSVTIGGVTVPAGQVTVGNGGTTATFTTPAHPVGPVSVTVATGFGTSTPPLTYTYDPPTAQAISPNTGPSTGGTPVTITGTGFVSGATSVTIGGTVVPASAVTVVNSTTLQFVTPTHPAGPVAVTVTTPDGTSTPPLSFFYSSASCILTGGNAATVTVTASVGSNTALVGSRFSVTLNGQPVGIPTPVIPLPGGFLVGVQASVPLPDSTISVGYTLTALDGSYVTVVGGPITCTPLTPTQRAAGIYHPLQSARLLDTRKSVKLAAGATYTLQVLGRGGVPVSKVASVVANLTVTRPLANGYLTVYPEGSRPNTSSVNFAAQQTLANLLTAPVGADGKIRIFNASSRPTDVLLDVSGYFSSGDTVAPGSYKRLDPARILDTNAAVGVPTRTPVPAGGVLTLKVTGVGGVAATNVSAVALNLTVDQTQGNGFITVFKSGNPPNISSLNFLRGQTDANLVIAPVAADGTIKIRNVSTRGVRLIADVSGYFLGGVPILDGEFVAVSPVRALDTRVTRQPVAPLATITPTMVGRNGVPATGVSAVVLNVTVDHTIGNGYITVFPHDPRPTASNLNFIAGQPRPNSVIGPVGSDGKLRMFNGSERPVDLIADVSGYFISNPLR